MCLHLALRTAPRGPQVALFVPGPLASAAARSRRPEVVGSGHSTSPTLGQRSQYRSHFTEAEAETRGWAIRNTHQWLSTAYKIPAGFPSGCVNWCDPLLKPVQQHRWGPLGPL